MIVIKTNRLWTKVKNKMGHPSLITCNGDKLLNMNYSKPLCNVFWHSLLDNWWQCMNATLGLWPSGRVTFLVFLDGMVISIGLQSLMAPTWHNSHLDTLFSLHLEHVDICCDIKFQMQSFWGKFLQTDKEENYHFLVHSKSDRIYQEVFCSKSFCSNMCDCL